MEGLAQFLKFKEADNLLRQLNPIQSRKEGRIIIEQEEYIDFSSNDYLGLSCHPKIREAAINAWQNWGSSSCASRLLSGDFSLHHQLEDKIRQFKNKPAGLIFNSGYQANIGIISALVGKDDCVFIDRLAHASLIDGVVLSKAKFFRFRHNDLEHLDYLLAKERNSFKRALVITETVFSMDGDIAPIKAMAEFKNKYDFLFMVDEAHATGIYGENGSGLVEEEGVTEQVDLIMGTFSKALAGFGAYLACSQTIKDYLINTARSFIYSTALPPAIIAANIASLDLINQEPFRRKVLLENTAYFRQELINLGFSTLGQTQIVPVLLGKVEKTLRLSQYCKGLGFWVMPIRPPTVPNNQARLRFSLSYWHSKDILNKVLQGLKGV